MSRAVKVTNGTFVPYAVGAKARDAIVEAFTLEVYNLGAELGEHDRLCATCSGQPLELRDGHDPRRRPVRRCGRRFRKARALRHAERQLRASKQLTIGGAL